MSDADDPGGDSGEKAKQDKEKRPRRNRRGLALTLYLLVKLLVDWWFDSH